MSDCKSNSNLPTWESHRDAPTIHKNWWSNNGKDHDGGVSTGIGFTIAWQRGPLSNGRNGAFLLDVLDSCAQQLSCVNEGRFVCEENNRALEHINKAIEQLNARLERRRSEGTAGTTKG